MVVDLIEFASVDTFSFSSTSLEMSFLSEQILQYRPLESNETFRLLRYLHKRTPADQPSFDLVHVTFADIPSIVPHYMAVSYAWGDPTPAHTFWINGSLCRLPKSSFEFLESLSTLETKSQPYFWIDAICINQADLAEKAIQIPLMKHIYSNAATVFVWLGPPIPGRTSILYFLEMARKNYELAELKEYHNLDWYLAKTSTTIESPEWQEIADLFCKPFFTRFWCIQEIVLSKKIMAYDGRSGCNWNQLSFAHNALSEGIHRHLRLRGRLKGVVAPHFEYVRSLQSDYHYGRREHTFKSFTWMWQQSMSYQARNMVDYVYGALGLITSESGDSPAIIPDYGRSDVDVFAEAVTLCLRRDNNYDVLSLAGVGFAKESNSQDTLPSWTPNFALTPTPRILTFWPRYPNRAGFLALEGVELKPDFRLENARLIVKGVIVDTIGEFIADTFLDMRTLDDEINHIHAWSRRALAAVHDSLLFDISTPESWEKWARTMSSHYKGPDEEYWLKGYVKLYESFLKAHVNNPRVQGLHPLDATKVINDDDHFSEDQKLQANHYYNAITLPLQWKRIAVTERGDLAVVQRLSKLGDKVCILPSGKVPLLIRQVPDTDSGNNHSHYQLVGESYVDGLMFGEGLSMGSLQDIVLV